MSAKAVAYRAQGFRAGPRDHTFYACAEHRPELEVPVPNFFILTDSGVQELPTDERDEFDCDFCREGGE